MHRCAERLGNATGESLHRMDDCMQMIGHHDVRVEHDVRVVVGNVGPVVVDELSEWGV
ncbi:MAG: hypothetical protein RLZZ297_1365 [Chloroflexota bacterium]